MIDSRTNNTQYEAITDPLALSLGLRLVSPPADRKPVNAVVIVFVIPTVSLEVTASTF